MTGAEEILFWRWEGPLGAVAAVVGAAVLFPVEAGRGHR